MNQKKHDFNLTPSQTMQAYLDSFVENNMDKLFSLFAKEAIVEFPYAFGDLSTKVEGIEAIKNYYQDATKYFEFHKYYDVNIYETNDSNSIVAEFKCDAKTLSTNKDYPQVYISTLRLENHLIAHYKEYWNPLIVQNAFGGDDPTADAFEK